MTETRRESHDGRSRSLPSLTVCSFTAAAPSRVAAALAPLRSVATSIVVAVDAKCWDPAALSTLSEIADDVICKPFEFPLEANLAWLHDQCKTEWVLRLDGDEVPSHELVRRLATLGWNEDVTHIYLPRRWLWGGTATVLDESPWWPDPQLRLIRNGHAVFPTGVHQPAEVSGPGRWFEEPIYHLDLLLNDRATRVEKSMRYESSAPGMRTESGLSQNIGFYVPEQGERRTRVSRIPHDDERLIGSVIAGQPATTSTLRSRMQRQPMRSAIAAASPIPADGSENVTVDIFDAGPECWVASSSATVTVRVLNSTAHVLRSGQTPPVRVGGRLLDERGDPWGGELRAELPCPIRPGRFELVRLTVAPTPPPGRYTLEVGLVRDGVAWFDSFAICRVTTVRQRRVLVSAGFSPHRHLGDDLIVRACLCAVAMEMPSIEPVMLAIDPADATRRFGARAVPDAVGIVHRDGRASLPVALRRILSIKRDAKRVAHGQRPHDPHHTALLDAFLAADGLLLMGAGWLTSRYRDAQLLPKLAEVEAARTLGVPVVFESGTVGPFTNRIDRLIARRILRTARSVSVRDGTRSATNARSLGVADDRLMCVPDAATWPATDVFPTIDRWLQQHGVDPSNRWAVVSVRDPRDPTASSDARHTVEAIAACVRALADEGVPAIFLPHCVDPAVDDRIAGELVAERSPLIIDGDMPPDDVALGIIRRAAVVVGNRFHLALVADSAGVPGVFFGTSTFDEQRSAAFAGGNITVVHSPADAAEAAAYALNRGRGDPGPAWSPSELRRSLRSAMRGSERGEGRPWRYSPQSR